MANADSFTLDVSGLNQTSTSVIQPLNEDVYVTSLYGTLINNTQGTSQGLGEFYCVDTADNIGVPTSYAVTPTVATGSYAIAASLVTDFSPGYPGPAFNGNGPDLAALNTQLGFSVSSAQLDSGLQLAIWETVNGITGGSDSTMNTIAADMIAINGGASVNTGVLLQEQGGNGQSMLYVPGIGGPTPSPEPCTMALGIAGVGTFLARRKAASKK